ncbi:hypothetical protein I6A84_21830 [Frankia sp. CNm7]|uniref:Uncharacterized protein n=1 Tax=Frankia nepalensis TaxID=1836974 RepID=A0A937USG9_9ACTN|nr:hypothetical protein [Frankia nepalensis]MBL7494721.1 hypothetical protein [Frankia nepalensis]MBL7508712.1 hypothetical protein [Frankia nepalensis]MBL7520654.1 hypothetical protein [Frankia nepalensis]MBL7628876.1 hypothetical protein [Frankia nepalensis]
MYEVVLREVCPRASSPGRGSGAWRSPRGGDGENPQVLWAATRPRVSGTAGLSASPATTPATTAAGAHKVTRIDGQRSQRWTAALIRFLLSDEANREVLRGYLDEFAPLGDAMADAGGRLLATGSGRTPTEISTAVRARWAAFLDNAGLATEGTSRIRP